MKPAICICSMASGSPWHNGCSCCPADFMRRHREQGDRLRPRAEDSNADRLRGLPTHCPRRSRQIDTIYSGWCGREDSNLHGVTRCHLKAVRLPIPPRPHGEMGTFGFVSKTQRPKTADHVTNRPSRYKGHARARSVRLVTDSDDKSGICPNSRSQAAPSPTHTYMNPGMGKAKAGE